MKIVNIIGGLGNQMFEYAMYVSLCHVHPDEDVKVCTRSYRGYGLHNGFELANLFGVNPSEASIHDLAKVAYPYKGYRWWQIVNHILPKRRKMIKCDMYHPYDENDVSLKGDAYYDGYWQNEKYFNSVRQQLLSIYKFPDITDEKNLELARRIESSVSVSCHVRRGDYLKEPEFCVCTPDYYRRAIAKMNEAVSPDLYCVFSNDIEWCRENLMDSFAGKDVVFVDWNKKENSFRDMQLMSLCKHNIIANSSFSWWGAWLNENEGKIVVVPEQWKKDDIVNDPICETWTRVEI